VPRLESDAILAADGARLPLRVWLPEGEVEAVILALHGMNDYANAFAEPAAFWRARGIAVYAYDQRGFGATATRGFWPGHDVLAGDLEAAAALLGARHPGKRVFVVGESMGGAVALASLAGARPAAVDGAILVAPAVWGRATMGLVPRVALWASVRVAPSMTLTGRGFEVKPSDNIEMLRALARDPLVIKGTRVDAIWGLVNLMDEALDAAPRVKTPLLVLYGAKDELIPKAPTRLFLDRLPKATDARIAYYPAGYHMLMRDLQANVVLADVAAWVKGRANGHTPALPSGADARGRTALAAEEPPEIDARERAAP
jgi:alpha-beta hydrolase superfamily lysophospholipase